MSRLITTIEQFSYYREFAHSVFNYFNGKINKYILCKLEVYYCDTVDYTFAKLRRPNEVIIYIDNIVSECGNGYNKNKICSMIIIAIVHELSHVEQVISQEDYKLSISYGKAIEMGVDKIVYEYLSKNKKYIDSVFGVDLDLSYFNSIDTFSGYYQNISEIEYIYKYTIMNVIFRKDINYRRFETDVLDKYSDIVISFENIGNFLIKSNGEFCDLTLNIFIDAVGAAAGKYDRYTVNTNVVEQPYRDKSNVALVTFRLSNRYIYPMVFSN